MHSQDPGMYSRVYLHDVHVASACCCAYVVYVQDVAIVSHVQSLCADVGIVSPCAESMCRI